MVVGMGSYIKKSARIKFLKYFFGLHGQNYAMNRCVKPYKDSTTLVNIHLNMLSVPCC